MADRLFMARSTYSKLESGSTTLPYDKLISISKILNVPVYEILTEDGELFLSSLFDKFSLMLSQTYHTLSETLFTTIPYDNLEPKHLAQLLPKGITSREAYEDTPLGGRIYKFGPKEAFQRMMQHYGMDVLFEENMIKDKYWLQKWKAYKGNTNSEFELDDKEYFVVHIIMLTMLDAEERWVQMAERDFPEGADEDEVLNYIVNKTGALTGEYMAFTIDGYDPFSEIIR